MPTPIVRLPTTDLQGRPPISNGGPRSARLQTLRHAGGGVCRGAPRRANGHCGRAREATSAARRRPPRCHLWSRLLPAVNVAGHATNINTGLSGRERWGRSVDFTLAYAVTVEDGDV